MGSERNVEDLFALYVDRLNAGEPVDGARIREEYPDLADELLPLLEDFIDVAEPEAGLDRVTVFGDYTLRCQLGRGGMGVVYEAWQHSMDRLVALKVLPPGVAADDRAFQRFMQEAKTAGKLNHQNVVSVHSTGVEEGTPWYSMEYVAGETLAQILAKTKDAEAETETGTPFGAKDEVGYFAALAKAFADVADGLQHAHSKGVTPRDVKPSNLILDDDGRLRILDFGLARLEGQESLTRSGDFVGTPLYMSPEQARRKKIPVDHRMDVYSLGATMYEALTSRPPFRGRDHADTLSQITERNPVEPKKVNPRVPKDFETIVLKCLRKDASDRYGTAEALGQDLRRFVRGDPVEARPEARWQRLASRLRRNRTPAVVAFVVVALAATTGWLFWERQDSAQRENAAERARLEAEYPGRLRLAVAKLLAGQLNMEAGIPFRSGAIRLPAELESIFREDLRRIGEHGAVRSVRAALEDLHLLSRELPDKRDTHYYLARAHHVLGDSEEAVAEARRTLTIDPDFYPAEFLIAEIENDGVLPRRELLRITNPPWAVQWARTRLALGEKHLIRSERNWLTAEEAYGKLIKIALEEEPYIGSLLESYIGRGVACLELGRLDDAIQHFSKAEHLAPTSLEPTLLLGKAYLLAEKPEHAHSIFRDRFDGEDPQRKGEIAVWISMVCFSLNDFDAAIPWATYIPAEGSRERLLALLYWRLGQLDQALAAAGRALRAEPESLSAHLIHSTVLLDELHDKPTDGKAEVHTDLIVELVDTATQAVRRYPDSRLAEHLLRRSWEHVRRRISTNTHKGTFMFQLRTKLFNTAAAAGFFLQAATAGANEFFDDFSDGQVFDCEPFCWDDAGECCPGEITIGDNGVCMRGDRVGVSTGFGLREVFTGDVSVVVEASPLQSGAVGAQICVDPVEGRLYWLIIAEGSFGILRFDALDRLAHNSPRCPSIRKPNPSSMSCGLSAHASKLYFGPPVPRRPRAS